MSLAPKLAVPASVPSSVPAKAPRNGLTRWLLQHRVQPVGPEAAEGHAEPQAWWKVMWGSGPPTTSAAS